VESLKMVGMPASASFVFVGEGRLNQTIVLFPNADFALVCNLLQGIHGQPVDDRPATLLSGSGAIIDGDRPSPPQPRRLDRGYPISGRSPESACCLQPKLHGAFVTRTS
jgi:hypothetical protein